jgi:hypothetical protein
LGWTLFFMIVILKIPLFAALYLIWYAVKEPEPEEEPGGEERGPRRKLPPFPGRPRRGPVGGGDCKPPPCPQKRDRIPAYAGRTLARRN